MMSIDLVFHLPRMCHYPEAHGRLGWGGRTQFNSRRIACRLLQTLV